MCVCKGEMGGADCWGDQVSLDGCQDTRGSGGLHRETAGECIVLIYFLFQGCPVGLGFFFCVQLSYSYLLY